MEKIKNKRKKNVSIQIYKLKKKKKPLSSRVFHLQQRIYNQIPKTKPF